MFGDMMKLSGFWGSGFGREDLRIACFRLQMFNNNMLKPSNQICLKCQHQLKKKTTTIEKMLENIQKTYQ